MDQIQAVRSSSPSVIDKIVTYLEQQQKVDYIRPPQKDTIESMKKKFDYSLGERQKPLLTHPQQINFLEDTEKLHDKNNQNTEDTIKQLQEEYQNLSEEKKEVFQQNLKHAQNMNTWSVMKDVAGCFMDFIYIYAGSSCLSSVVRPIFGASMITSGGLDLANKLMYYTNGWHYISSCFSNMEDAQNNLTEKFYKGCQITSWVLGAASMQAGDVFQNLPFSEIATKTFFGTFQFFSAAINLGQNLEKSKLQEFEGKNNQFEARERTLMFQIETELDFAREDRTWQKDMTNKEAEKLQTLININDILLRTKKRKV